MHIQIDTQSRIQLLTAWHQDSKISSCSYTPILYSDDIIIFCRANTQEISSIKTIIDKHCSWSGQHINLHKSNIIRSRNIDQNLRDHISSILHIQMAQDLLNTQDIIYQQGKIRNPISRTSSQLSKPNWKVGKLSCSLRQKKPPS